MENKYFRELSDQDWEKILKPDLKEILRPNLKKIIVFVVILILSLIPHAINNHIWCFLIGGEFCSTPLRNNILGFPFVFYNFFTKSFELIGLIGNLIVIYIVSCVIVWLAEFLMHKRYKF